MKKIKGFFAFLVIFSIVILNPFVVEWMLLNETTWPFNIPISFSRETWFGFMASYMGAIGTVILGIIALWQNERYKQLADKSSQESAQIQQELKSLSKKTMEAIETLKKIELAKYYPLIEKISYTCHGTTKEHFLKEFGSEDYAIQINCINFKGENDLLLPVSELVDKYNTYLFVVKNISEKSIRNFNCNQIIINGKQPSYVVNFGCDIASGKYAVIAIVNFPQFNEHEDIDLKMTFVFKNLVMDNYFIETEIVIIFNEEAPNSHVLYFTYPEIYEDKELI